MGEVELGILLLTLHTFIILLFHRGKYPQPSISAGKRSRELVEATIIFAVLLVFYWLQTVYRPIVSWGIATSLYLIVGACFLVVMELIVRKRAVSIVGVKLPTNRKSVIVFILIFGIWMIGGVFRRFMLGGGYSSLDITLVSGVIVGPVVEEIIFRGLIQTRLEVGLGVVRSWMLSGLLFGFYHYWAHFLIPGNALTLVSLIQVMNISILGMMFGVIYAKTRSLIPPIMLHAVNNFSALFGWS